MKCLFGAPIGINDVNTIGYWCPSDFEVSPPPDRVA